MLNPANMRNILEYKDTSIGNLTNDYFRVVGCEYLMFFDLYI